MVRYDLWIRARLRAGIAVIPAVKCAILAGLLLTPPAAVASGIGESLCSVSDIVLVGSVGRALATIGIIIVGVMATLGRVTWTQGVTVAVGIAVMFGAVSLAAMLSLGVGKECASTSPGSSGPPTQGCVQLGHPGDNAFWCPPGATPPG